MYWFSQRVYQWWHAVSSCWQKKETLLCMWPTGYDAAQTRCFQSQRREKNSPPFLSLSSLPVSQLYMFNELASFLHPPPPTATFPPCPHLLFLVALSFLYPMFFLLAFTTLQRGLREKTTLCYQETFFFCHSISLSQSHIPCQECEICKGGKSHCCRSNNRVNKRTLFKLRFTDLGTCKTDNCIKKPILHFNLSTRIVLISRHHLNTNSLCWGL